MVIGDLNAGVNLECMKCFCETYDLNSLIKVPTCYKNPEKPLCIDLLLTNRPKTFQSETGLTDFHKMTVTVMKTTFEKFKPRVSDRNWNEFWNKKLEHNCLLDYHWKTSMIVAMASTNSKKYALMPLTYLHPARKYTCGGSICHSWAKT